MRTDRRLIIGLFFLLLLLIAVPLSIYILRQQTQLQQHASERSYTSDDQKVDNFFDNDNELRQKGISMRYKVCRHNDTPRKCVHIVVIEFPHHPWRQRKPTYPQPVQNDLDDIIENPSPGLSVSVTTAPTVVTEDLRSRPSFGSTTIVVTLCPHGIGFCGDNVASPGKASMNPVHTTRQATLTLYDSTNQPVFSQDITVNFDSAAGNFKGTIDVGNINTGAYTVKVKMPQHLGAVLPGTQLITKHQSNTLPLIYLIAGDITDDNVINIQDYEALMNCYSNLSEATGCSDSQNTASDLNDDGAVDFIDYNLFVRELSSQRGI